MRKYRVWGCVVLFVILSSFFTMAMEVAPSKVFVFEHVNIIPMTSEVVLYDMTVVVVDGKIQTMGQASETTTPNNATIIDGSGKYLMPGLADMHTHLMAEDDMALYLANGVTMVRNMWGGPFHLTLRSKVEEGLIRGPRILTTSPLMDGFPPVWPGSTVIVSTFQAKSLVAQYKEQGYDYIKVYDRLSENIYRAILKEAKIQDIPVVGHVPYKVGAKKAMLYGQKSFEHVFGYNNPGLYQMTVEYNVWNCPTLIAFLSKDKSYYPELIEGIEYIPEERLNIWEIQQYDGNYDWAVKLTSGLHEAGAKLLAGTDANNPYIIPGFSIHEELERMTTAGLTTYETLRTATVNAAEFVGITDEIGTIEVGKKAEFILLTQNPLVDIRNTKLLEGVMVKGEWLDKAVLDASLLEILEKNSALVGE